MIGATRLAGQAHAESWNSPSDPPGPPCSRRGGRRRRQVDEATLGVPDPSLGPSGCCRRIHISRCHAGSSREGSYYADRPAPGRLAASGHRQDSQPPAGWGQRRTGPFRHSRFCGASRTNGDPRPCRPCGSKSAPRASIEKHPDCRPQWSSLRATARPAAGGPALWVARPHRDHPDPASHSGNPLPAGHGTGGNRPARSESCCGLARHARHHHRNRLPLRRARATDPERSRRRPAGLPRQWSRESQGVVRRRARDSRRPPHHRGNADEQRESLRTG